MTPNDYARIRDLLCRHGMGGSNSTPCGPFPDGSRARRVLVIPVSEPA